MICRSCKYNDRFGGGDKCSYCGKVMRRPNESQVLRRVGSYSSVITGKERGKTFYECQPSKYLTIGEITKINRKTGLVILGINERKTFFCKSSDLGGFF